jgi:peroxiredoxin
LESKVETKKVVHVLLLALALGVLVLLVSPILRSSEPPKPAGASGVEGEPAASASATGDEREVTVFPGAEAPGHALFEDAVVASIYDEAPDFRVADTTGRPTRLSEHREKAVVAVWFTNLCSGCLKNMPALQAAYEERRASGFEVLAVSVLGDDKSTLRKAKAETGVTFPLLLDPDGRACELYAGKYMPQACPLVNFFIVDRAGRLRYKGHYPGLSPDELRAEMDKVLSAGT